MGWLSIRRKWVMDFVLCLYGKNQPGSLGEIVYMIIHTCNLTNKHTASSKSSTCSFLCCNYQNSCILLLQVHLTSFCFKRIQEKGWNNSSLVKRAGAFIWEFSSLACRDLSSSHWDLIGKQASLPNHINAARFCLLMGLAFLCIIRCY